MNDKYILISNRIGEIDMKIVHLCLTAPYEDGWGYQENILTKYHKRIGHDVTIVTNTLLLTKENGKYKKADFNDYVNHDGIRVRRIDFLLGKWDIHCFRLYKGLVNTLDEEKPDILFVHGCQFLDLIKLKGFLKKSSHVKLIIDNHADFSNSANTLFTKLIHKLLWKNCVKFIDSFVSIYYGVLPARVDFLVEMYGISKEKVKLLVMGADDDLVVSQERRSVLRDKYGLSRDAFLILTGGKIDKAKLESLELMKAVNNIKNSFSNIHLVVFGSVEDSIQEKFNSLLSEAITFLGWKNQTELQELLAISDLAVFPGRHSVIWEQAVASKIPCVFKKWKGTTHIDLGGNCILIDNPNEENLTDILNKILLNESVYQRMNLVASSEASEKFLYSHIAKDSLEYIKI